MLRLGATVMLTLALVSAAADESDCARMCDDNKCIKAKLVCNGRKDCRDGSDETDCESWACAENHVKCRDNRQCITIAAVCDGHRTHCWDGSDEAASECESRSCPDPFLKCHSGRQCVHRKNFCQKADRGSGQYHCNDRSDETVWGCREVGVSCDVSSSLWPCGTPERNSSSDVADLRLCIATSKVCDGVVGIKDNNCAQGEDEHNELCRSWSCSTNRVKCSNGAQCIPVLSVCDGVQTCSDNSDETALDIGHGRLNQCNVKGSPCISLASSHYWLDEAVAGGRCDLRTCIDADRFCDGNCDCGPDCFDEDTDFCATWNCTQGFFKCKTQGTCIPVHKVCDGAYDCAWDASDEEDCVCSAGSQSSSFLRDLILHFVANACPVDSLDAACLERVRVSVSANHTAKTVNVVVSEDCGWATCSFDRMDLRPGGKSVVFKQAALVLPLVHRGFVYNGPFVASSTSASEAASDATAPCNGLLLDSLASRLLSALVVLANATETDACSCRFPVWGRDSTGSADPRLPPLALQDMDAFHRHMDSYLTTTQIVYYSTQEDRCHIGNQDAALITLNDVFPTTEYGSGLASDDKNLPLNIFAYRVPLSCSESDFGLEGSESGLRLLTLAALAASGRLKAADGRPWVSLQPEPLCALQAVVCRRSTRTVEYVYSGSKLTFLVLAAEDLKPLLIASCNATEKSLFRNNRLHFVISDQRLGLEKTHGLRDLNMTKAVTVIFSASVNEFLLRNADRKLLHELLVVGNDIEVNKNVRLVQLPRTHRSYVQLKGNASFDDVLIGNGIDVGNVSFVRVCPSQNNLDCEVDELNDIEQIAKAINSRWAKSCLRMNFVDNAYVVLPVSVDNIYFTSDSNNDWLVTERNDSLQLKLHSRVLEADRTDSAFFHPQTKLVWPEGSTLCPNRRRILFDHPDFYLPTLVSALLHSNAACAREICFSASAMFAVRGRFAFLGPFDTVWDSNCLVEMGPEVIEAVTAASRHGFLSVNKFWPFDHYNYFVYSNISGGSESSYLSPLAFTGATLAGVVMALICLATVLGNALVFAAILVDPVVKAKKSVYQYLQLSLCLADMLLGAAGPGSIVGVQLGLMTGLVSIDSFLASDAFTATFERPQQAAATGLNRLYFITKKPALVLCGTLVSLSTTVSMLLLLCMSFTRQQVVSPPSRQSALFRLASRRPVAAAAVPWAVGAVITLTHFIEIDEQGRIEFTIQAFFDPLSKLTLLLPSSSRPVSFFVQASLSAVVSVVTVGFAVAAYVIIARNAEEVKQRGMISQEHERRRRLLEERRWLRLTASITAAFVVSVLPVATTYACSVLGLRSPPAVHMAAWWMLVAGGLIDVAVYAGASNAVKASMGATVRLLLFKLRLISTDPTRAAKPASTEEETRPIHRHSKAKS